MRLSVQTLKDYLLERQIKPTLPDQGKYTGCCLCLKEFLSDIIFKQEMMLWCKMIPFKISKKETKIRKNVPK